MVKEHLKQFHAKIRRICWNYIRWDGQIDAKGGYDCWIDNPIANVGLYFHPETWEFQIFHNGRGVSREGERALQSFLPGNIAVFAPSLQEKFPLFCSSFSGCVSGEMEVLEIIPFEHVDLDWPMQAVLVRASSGVFWFSNNYLKLAPWYYEY